MPYTSNQSNLGTGALLDRLDTRDYKWSEVGSVLPPFGWNEEYSVLDEVKSAIGNPAFVLNAKNQDGSYSCGGQAWAYYGAVLESIFTKSYEERSAKFIYSQTYVQGGGSSGRDNNNLVTKQGWGLESLTPSYENGMPPGEYFMERGQDITDNARAQAKLSKALSYASVDFGIDSLAQACKANHGLIIGIVGKNNGTWMSRKPAPPKKKDDQLWQSPWYHWMYVGGAGMFEGEKAIRAINSWGNVAGDRGWQWITESYLNAILDDSSHGNKTVFGAWTLMYDKNPQPSQGFTHRFEVPIEFGMNSSEVKALQTALKLTGDFPSSVPVTGFYGNITAQAVYKFQIRNGVYPTARDHVGPKTRDILNTIFDK